MTRKVPPLPLNHRPWISRSGHPATGLMTTCGRPSSGTSRVRPGAGSSARPWSPVATAAFPWVGRSLLRDSLGPWSLG